MGSLFTTELLSAAGTNTLSVTVTDSRGRSATMTKTITILDYSAPSLTLFTAQRCNGSGSEVQVGGNHVRISVTAASAPVNNRNTMSCKVYYRSTGSTAWTLSTTITPVSYTVNTVNRMLSQTFDPLHGYELKVQIADYFSSIEQIVAIGTKQVILPSAWLPRPQMPWNSVCP